MPTGEDFRVTLRAWMQGAEHASETTVEINSGQLHREVGGYPGQNHRMPMCCAVMRSEMSAGDAILQEPPKKQRLAHDPLQASPLLMEMIMPKGPRGEAGHVRVVQPEPLPSRGSSRPLGPRREGLAALDQARRPPARRDPRR